MKMNMRIACQNKCTTKKQFSTSSLTHISKRSLSTYLNNIPIKPLKEGPRNTRPLNHCSLGSLKHKATGTGTALQVPAHSQLQMHTHMHMQYRGYKIQSTSAVATCTDKDSNQKHVNVVPTKEVQEELDELLATAYIKAKQISSLATTRKKPSKRGASHSYIPEVIAPTNASPSTNMIERSLDYHNENNNVNANANANGDNNEDGSKYEYEYEIVLNRIENDDNTQGKAPRAGEGDPTRKRIAIEDEVNAVQALLSMTSHPYFHKALAQQRERNSRIHTTSTTTTCSSSMQATREGKEGQNSDSNNDVMNVSLSLHSAFLSVITWLLGTLSSLPSVDEHESEQQINLISELHEGTTGTSSFTNNEKHDTGTTTALCITEPSNQSILLTQIYYLTERSRELNLPFTIPQYKSIAYMIAKHSSAPDKSIIILNLSTELSMGFDSLEPHFFSGALRELLNRNHLRDMIEVLHGMRNIHEIQNVDLQTAMELLNILKEKVDDSMSMSGGKRKPTGFDETDAMELAMILQKPVMNELQSKRREDYEGQIQNTMGTLMDQDLDEDFDEDDDGGENLDNFDANIDIDSDGRDPDGIDRYARIEEDLIVTPEEFEGVDAYDGYKEDVKQFNEMTARLSGLPGQGEEAKILMGQLSDCAKTIIKKLQSVKASEIDENENDGEVVGDSEVPAENSNSSGMSARFHVDPATGEVANVEFIFTPKQPEGVSENEKKLHHDLYQGMVRDVIYCRDESWSLPDVIPQLEEWNGDRSIFFSKGFEADILAERTGYDDFIDDESLRGVANEDTIEEEKDE